MKKTISFFTKGKAFLCSLLLVGGMMLLSTGNASAQQTANGTVNPYTHLAEKLNVPAYAMGTFDRTHTMDVLENIVTSLKQVVGSGGGSNYQKLKLAYCNEVLSDISALHISTEISLLTSLGNLTAKESHIGLQQSQLQTLYNEIVAQLQ